MKQASFPTQKQINRSLEPSIGQKIRRGAGIIILGTASWLFFHAMLPSTAFAQDRKGANSAQKAPAQASQESDSLIIPRPAADADSALVNRLLARAPDLKYFFAIDYTIPGESKQEMFYVKWDSQRGNLVIGVMDQTRLMRGQPAKRVNEWMIYDPASSKIVFGSAEPVKF